jgi:hypothetical protein
VPFVDYNYLVWVVWHHCDISCTEQEKPVAEENTIRSGIPYSPMRCKIRTLRDSSNSIGCFIIWITIVLLGSLGKRTPVYKLFDSDRFTKLFDNFKLVKCMKCCYSNWCIWSPKGKKRHKQNNSLVQYAQENTDYNYIDFLQIIKLNKMVLHYL